MLQLTSMVIFCASNSVPALQRASFGTLLIPIVVMCVLLCSCAFQQNPYKIKPKALENRTGLHRLLLIYSLHIPDAGPFL